MTDNPQASIMLPPILVPPIAGMPPLTAARPLRNDMPIDQWADCVQLGAELQDLYEQITKADGFHALMGMVVRLDDPFKYFQAGSQHTLRTQYNQRLTQFRDRCEPHQVLQNLPTGKAANDNEVNCVAVDLPDAALPSVPSYGAPLTAGGRAFSITIPVGPMPSDAVVLRGVAAVVIVGAIFVVATALSPVGL